MKSRKMRYAFPGIVFLITTMLCLPAYAGSVNGNEQSVISVIHGQFEKDGIIYAVKQEYINSAVNYLSRDDVDLTAEQAGEVISEIYANVQTGVESGYLTAVGGSKPADAPKDSETDSRSASTDADQAESQGAGEVSGGEVSLESADQSPADETGEAATTEAKETEATEAETVPEVISILELVDKAPSQSYDYISRDTDALMQNVHIPYAVLLWLMVCLAAVMAIVCGIAVRGKLFTSHRHHKLRNVLKYVLAAEIAVLTTVCLGVIGLWLAAFQDSAVLNKLAETGYYRTIYNELRQDTSISLALLDIPEEVMDESITYERVVLAARQQVESDLSRGDYKADTSMLADQLEKDIQSFLANKSVVMTEQAENGLNLLMNRLQEKYDSLLRWPFASWWVKLCGEFFQAVKLILPIGLFLWAAAQILVLYLYHYKHRGVALCGKGVLCGSVGLVLAGFAGIAGSRGIILHMEPEYMKTFLEIYGNGICMTGIVTGGIGILIGAIYLLIVKAWKEGKR